MARAPRVSDPGSGPLSRGGVMAARPLGHETTKTPHHCLSSESTLRLPGSQCTVSSLAAPRLLQHHSPRVSASAEDESAVGELAPVQKDYSGFILEICYTALGPGSASQADTRETLLQFIPVRTQRSETLLLGDGTDSQAVHGRAVTVGHLGGPSPVMWARFCSGPLGAEHPQTGNLLLQGLLGHGVDVSQGPSYRLSDPP
ncbi:unnamed protein product [Lota lota]